MRAALDHRRTPARTGVWPPFPRLWSTSTTRPPMNPPAPVTSTCASAGIADRLEIVLPGHRKATPVRVTLFYQSEGRHDIAT